MDQAAEDEGIARRLVGTWRLLGCERQEVATGERSLPFGERPSGSITYTASGHMVALITRDGRKPPQSVAERAALHAGMLAYSGRWTVEDGSVRHRLEVSWQPATVGDTFIRHVTFDGDRLILRSPPGPSAVDGVVAVVTVTWERAG